MEIPIYVFTGLLNSGKTTLIREVVSEEDFLEPGNTLLIQCEEGEYSLEENFLKSYGIIKIDVEDSEELNEIFWRHCQKVYSPAQILIEYNGMWEMEPLFNSNMPEDWYIGGIYSTVDSSTADLFLLNMRKMFMEPLKLSNLVIFNRCTENTDRMKLRRSVKVLNSRTDFVFERTDGTLFDNESEVMPFALDGDLIEIEDMDYGLWYLDAMDHPDRYMGKELLFTGRFCRSIHPGENYFIPGRHIMTCCEDDIEFLGFVCYFEGEMPFEHGDWVRVRVSYDHHFCSVYDSEGPVLTLKEIHPTEQPDPELVTFS